MGRPSARQQNRAHALRQAVAAIRVTMTVVTRQHRRRCAPPVYTPEEAPHAAAATVVGALKAGPQLLAR